jgi:branched-chain amino acid transport system ATP-binding protein
MDDLAGKFPNELSTGWRKLAAVGRALMGDAPLLLLDEPAAGLSHIESASLGEQLRNLVSDRRSLLLIDHDMDLIMSVCSRVYVLDLGRIIAEGSPYEIRRNKQVTDAYLGVRG